MLRLSRPWCTTGLFVIAIIVASAALASAKETGVDASERIAKLHAAAQRCGTSVRTHAPSHVHLPAAWS